jgi:hypothetical protein
MKRNIITGIILISALALSSCSTTKLATNQSNDDVYYSKAKAGDQPEYVAQTQQSPYTQDRYNNYDDGDYYYYNSYASRINRFGYLSPFGYYDDLYYGYSPYYGSSYGSYGYGSSYLGLGLGLGYGYGSYYGYNSYYGYGGYGGYGYNYFGTGYGYGGGGYWGVYSASNSGSPRPYRGSGAPTNALVNRSTRPVGYSGNYPVNSQYPGRPVVNNGTGGRQVVNSNGSNGGTYNGGSRPVRNDSPSPSYQPQATRSSSPPPSNTGSSSSGSSSSSSSSGGGGGGRPVRP